VVRNKSRKARKLTIVFAASTFFLMVPVVCAVVVSASLASENQTVLAGLEGERAICAQEELVAVLGMSVGLLADWFWTTWHLSKS
jgi:hypothetical protein